MSNSDPYVVKVASSIFMDSSGSFSSTAPAGVPVIPAGGFELPVDPTKLANALTSVSDAVKKYTNASNTESLALRRLGIAGSALKMLKDFGELAGQLAKFVPYVSAAVEVLKAFNILSDGSAAVAPALQQRFAQLNAMIIANQRQWADVTSAEYQNKIATALDSVMKYSEQLRVWESVPASQINWNTLDTQRALHRTFSLDGADGELNSFLTPSLWMFQQPGRDPDDPEHTFDPLRPLWLSLPTKTGGWQAASGEHVGYMARFDHRMMVHLVPAVVGTYLTTIKALLPEYRSVGVYRTKLFTLATNVEELMLKMKTENLARTDYTGFDLSDRYNPLGTRVPPRFDIGGYDLAAARTLPYGWTEWPQTGWWDTSDRVIDVGALTFNWPVPNLDEQGRRAAMDAETAIRYGSLLYSSGYFQLAQTAGLLRHLATAPEQSETVAAGFSHRRQSAESTSRVTVTGRPAFPFPDISAEVDQTSHRVIVDARVRTQSPVSCTLDPLPYRIQLRTLPARSTDCRSDYSDVFWTSRDAGARDREPSLRCTYTGAERDAKLIAEGITPRTVRTSDGTRTLRMSADTYDVWQSYPDTWSGVVTGPPRDGLAQAVITAAGNSTPDGFASTIDKLVIEHDLGFALDEPAEGDPAPVGSPTDRELGAPSIPEVAGQRRHLSHDRRVEFTYDYSWEGARLDLHLEFPSTCPNFDLYLVVEELIVNDQWRHTWYRIPVATQLIHVPQSFLDHEAENVRRAHKFWSDLNRHYSLSHQVGPGDAIAQVAVQAIRDSGTRESLAEAYRLHAPELLEQAMREI